MSSIPGQGTKIPHATRCSKKKKKKVLHAQWLQAEYPGPEFRALVQGLDGRQKGHLYPHIADKETDAQRGKGPRQGHRVPRYCKTSTICWSPVGLAPLALGPCGVAKVGDAGARGSPRPAQWGGGGAGPRARSWARVLRKQGVWLSAPGPPSLALTGCRAPHGASPHLPAQRGAQSSMEQRRGLALGKGGCGRGLSLPRSPR